MNKLLKTIILAIAIIFSATPVKARIYINGKSLEAIELEGIAKIQKNQTEILNAQIKELKKSNALKQAEPERNNVWGYFVDKIFTIVLTFVLTLLLAEFIKKPFKNFIKKTKKENK